MVHAFNENGPATVVDDRHDASQMMALGLRLGRRDHLARCRQGQHLFLYELRCRILRQEREHPEREAKCNRYPHDFSSFYVRRRTPCPIPFAVALDGLLVRYSRTLRRTVEGSKSVHLTWRQLPGDRAHLLVDIVLAQPLGKSCQL